MDKETLALYFRFFNEVGIIEQLSSTLLEAKLPRGFTTSHFSVLNHLVRVKDGQTPLALARAFQVPKTTMTHTLSGLERHKLVHLRPNPDDGRSKCVWLTEAGRAFRIQAIEGIAPDMERLSSRFPPEFFKELIPALSAIRVFLDEDRNTPAPKHQEEEL